MPNCKRSADGYRIECTVIGLLLSTGLSPDSRTPRSTHSVGRNSAGMRGILPIIHGVVWAGQRGTSHALFG